mmetsp:Transcript_17494/g.34571  ORF Transcript_17494/g.34571 Transcript_17494/m.34571 type:complete len:470 (+) Transcript_17494:128-1537(+)
MEKYNRHKMSSLVEAFQELEEKCIISKYADPAHLSGPSAVPIFFTGMGIAFLGLSIVCETYFVPAIQILIDEFGVPEDVAGATFMAIGACAPELLASLLGTFSDPGGGGSDIGMGVVIGSLIFNQLFIIGGSILVSPGGNLRLNWRPLARDVFFFVCSVLLLAQLVDDGLVHAGEAAALTGLYGAYIVVLCYWTSALAALGLGGGGGEGGGGAEGADEKAGTQATAIGDVGGGALGEKEDLEKAAAAAAPALVVVAATAPPGSPDKHSSTPSNSPPGHLPLGICLRLLGFPLKRAFKVTIPDCTRSEARHRYPLTFAAALVWIAALVFFMNAWAEKTGCLLGVSPSIMGLTVGAAGTSAPNAFASFEVARLGFADMAVSEVLGSNVFCSAFALGLPWLLKTSLSGEPVAVAKGDMEVSLMVLFGCLLAFACGLAASGKMTLTKPHGYLYFVAYGAYILYLVLHDYGFVR